jgi:tRNA-modifying protein YgfZ
VPTGLAPLLATHLMRYVLRAKVTAAASEVTRDHLIALKAAIPGLDTLPDGDWSLAMIRAGIPVVTPATSGEWIPQMLNLDLLGAISFTKGCYTGQEIVARTQHLGRIKRRTFRFHAERCPRPGDPLWAGEHRVGEVVNAVATPSGSSFLAVKSLDATGPLHLAEGVPVTAEPLPYDLDTTVPSGP